MKPNNLSFGRLTVADVVESSTADHGNFPWARALGFFSALLFMAWGTGCYTQLYTGDYLNRDSDRLGGYPANARREANANRATETSVDVGENAVAEGETQALAFERCRDTLQNPKDTSACARYAQAFGAGDTLAPVRPGDTLTVGTRPVTDIAVVAVHNPYGYYHGYSELEWEYPFLSFEFYSHRHREYDHPYWWGYRSNGEGNPASGHNGGRDPDPRPIIYSHNQGYPSPRRGRRATAAAAGTGSGSGGGGAANSHGSQKSSSSGGSSWFSFGSGSSGGSSGSSSSSGSRSSSSSSNGGEKSSASSSGSSSSNRSESTAPEVHKGRRE